MELNKKMNANYYRLITRPYWPSEEKLEDIESCTQSLELKTIIKDFRSKDNTLSIWKLDKPIDFALSLINPNYHLDDMFIIKIAEDDLKNNNIDIINNSGNSIIDVLNDKHYDITDVDYQKLSVIIKMVLTALKNNQYEFVTSTEILDSIKELVKEDKINTKNLPKEIRSLI